MLTCSSWSMPRLRSLDPRQVLPLKDQEFQNVREVMERLGTCEEGALKPVYEALGERYEYGILRCIRAALCLRQG